MMKNKERSTDCTMGLYKQKLGSRVQIENQLIYKSVARKIQNEKKTANWH